MKVVIAVLLGVALMGATMGRNLRVIHKGPRVTKHRIVNGQEAVPHSLPYQVWLQFTDEEEIYQWECGGTLISANYVLTAGHCTTGTRTVDVVLGAHSLKNAEDTKQNFTSTNIITHKDFDESILSNDIALVKLPRAATLNAAVNVIALSTLNKTELIGKIATISGWGLTKASATTEPDTLRVANVTVVATSVCEVYQVYQEDMHICTNDPEGRAVCQGDSGGPVTVDGKVAGIVSYGPQGCATEYGPDGSTRVFHYLDWIKANSDVQIE